MERRDLDEVERFLASVGRPNLFVYYGVELSADGDSLDEAVRKRRSWAQGQQSNPKYKSEALFLIKNNALLRRVLIEQNSEYRAHLVEDTTSRNLDTLTAFIRGTLAEGVLTPQGESAILYQGRQLELTDNATLRRLDELLAELGARREGFTDDMSTEATAIDHYAILRVATNATRDQIEEAYRKRYRWARNLKDLQRSAALLEALDNAWRILSDAGRRARYDERRIQMLEVTDEVERRAAALMGLLGGPEDSFTGDYPPPAEPTHEVGFKSRSERPEPPAAVAPPPIAPPVTPRPPEPRPIPVPSPPPLAGKTIGLAAGPQAVGTLGPRLHVEGPENIHVRAAARPITRTLVVQNQGQGKMPGRVTSDRDWILIPQPRLDPLAAEQAVVITIATDTLPRGTSVGVVTIVTDHGQRHSVNIHVQRQSLLPVVGGAIAIGVLGVFALVVFYLIGRWSTPATPAPEPPGDQPPVEAPAPGEAGKGE